MRKNFLKKKKLKKLYVVAFDAIEISTMLPPETQLSQDTEDPVSLSGSSSNLSVPNRLDHVFRK